MGKDMANAEYMNRGGIVEIRRLLENVVKKKEKPKRGCLRTEK